MNHSELEFRGLFLDVIDYLKLSMKKAMIENKCEGSPLLFFVLDNIQSIPNCTAQDITNKMHRDKGQITRLIKDLTEQGLVEKKINPKDKRSSFISLTKEGISYYSILKLADNKSLEIMKENISSEEFESFMQTGKKMVSNIKKHVEQ